MTSKLQARVRKAKAAAQFAKIINRDGQGRVRHVSVPGSGGKQRMVILHRYTRNGQWEFAASCNAVGPHGALVPCKGMQFHGPCYSTLAGLIVACEDAGYQISFCKSERAAWLYARLGGRPVKVWSRQARKHTTPVWAIVKRKK